MLDKMIGVSPPPKTGSAPEAKVKSDFRETAENKAYKRDFEKALQEKEDRRKQSLARSDQSPRKKEIGAEKKEKSSGGTKKKMTEVDDKMVSNVMASIESEVEIPEANEENPAKIEVDNPLKEKMIVADKATEKLGQSAVLGQMQFQEATPEGASLQPEQLSVDAELSAAVGFKPDGEVQKAAKDVIGKLKGFEAEQMPKSDQAVSFEKNVLAQLQKDAGLTEGNQFGKGEQGKDSGSDAKSSDAKPDLNSTSLHVGATHGQSDFKAHMTAAGAAPAMSPEAKLEASREANINEIMQQAHVLVKKGGGEVSVRMSPEGMGEVHLKVMLQDGKLNVEMQTGDRHVKKLIEESLSDLKSGLAAHRLSLEHVKIDTVNATNADNNTQMQSNLNQGGAEGRARDFWSETQRQMDHRGQRDQSGRSFRSDGDANVVAQPKASGAQALRTYGGTKGATINRVA